jgi:hypothetical protein
VKRLAARAGVALVAVMLGAAAVLLFRSRPPPPATAELTFGWVPCGSDRDCPGDQVCRKHLRPIAGPIRACTLVGPLAEEERCKSPANTPAEACRRELRCNFGRCGRACVDGGTETCPAGFACGPDLEEPSCIRTCQDRECPSGQRCVRFGPEVSLCARATGECDQTGCPPEEVCGWRFYAGDEEAVLRCVRPCSADGECPAGHLCDARECLPKCSASTPRCPDGWYCADANTLPEPRCRPKFPLWPLGW